MFKCIHNSFKWFYDNLFNFFCLEEKEKRKLYEKIDFYASMKLFEKWSYNAVKMLYYQTELLDCIRNQQVLKEGHDPLGIYLIKSGEFKVFILFYFFLKEIIQ